MYAWISLSMDSFRGCKLIFGEANKQHLASSTCFQACVKGGNNLNNLARQEAFDTEWDSATYNV